TTMSRLFRRNASARAPRRAFALTLLAASLAIASSADAQRRGGGPPATARDGALFDITGQWAAGVNAGWRSRRLTPPPGDVTSIPVNARGRAEAAAWDLERDGAAGELWKAFAAPGLSRQPTRIRIGWEDGDTLRLEFDAGRQTRKFEFGAQQPPAEHSLQGYSAASWVRKTVQRGVFGSQAPPGGSLDVVTTKLSPGYLRPNG